jgi:hypothetical protein
MGWAKFDERYYPDFNPTDDERAAREAWAELDRGPAVVVRGRWSAPPGRAQPRDVSDAVVACGPFSRRR